MSEKEKLYLKLNKFQSKKHGDKVKPDFYFGAREAFDWLYDHFLHEFDEDYTMIDELNYLISISKKSKQISSPIGDHHVPMLRAIKKLLQQIQGG